MEIQAREANGRPSRTGSAPAPAPALLKRVDEAVLLGLADASFGTALGKLRLAKKITKTQSISGEKWAKLAERYQRAIGAKGAPKSAALERSSPAEPLDPDSKVGIARAKIDAETEREWLDVTEAMIEKIGIVCFNMVRAVAERDEAAVGPDIVPLCRGLDFLTEYERRAKAPRKR